MEPSYLPKVSRKHKKEGEFLLKLETQISHLYEKIEINIIYSRGELDLIGHKNGQKDIYEVKATSKQKNLDKAEEQLQRAFECLQGIEKTFIYIGNEDKIIRYHPSR